MLSREYMNMPKTLSNRHIFLLSVQKCPFREWTPRSEIRNKLHAIIISNAKQLGFIHIRRPDRFGFGNYMTVAIVDRENWLGKDNEFLDKGPVIKTLNEYLTFLQDTIRC